MKYYIAHTPSTLEEDTAFLVATCIRVALAAGYAHEILITELYVIGDTLFAHTDDGDLFSIAVQKLTPTQEVTP